MYDVVVVGGLAGMSAAWKTRHLNGLALEKEDRIGGRLRSERRGPYWLNWGGHVFAGPDSEVGKLLAAVGVDAAPVPGNLTALAMNGKLKQSVRVCLPKPRCWKAQAICAEEVPALVVRSGSEHPSAYHFADEVLPLTVND